MLNCSHGAGLEEAICYGGATAWLEVHSSFSFPAETNGRDDTEQVGILVIQERDYIHREKRELLEKENRRQFMEGRHSLNRYRLYPNTSGSPNDF